MYGHAFDPAVGGATHHRQGGHAEAGEQVVAGKNPVIGSNLSLALFLCGAGA